MKGSDDIVVVTLPRYLDDCPQYWQNFMDYCMNQTQLEYQPEGSVDTIVEFIIEELAKYKGELVKRDYSDRDEDQVPTVVELSFPAEKDLSWFILRWQY